MADKQVEGGTEHTTFSLSADGVDLCFAGTEAFVEKQVVQFQGLIRRAVGTPAADIVPAGSARQAPLPALPAIRQHPSFEAFVQGKPVRAGRGKIQDRLLLTFLYEQHVRGRPSISTQDLMNRFGEADWEVPSTLHNHLGILKRKHAHIEGAERRGLYRLSDAGSRWAQGRFL